MRLLATRLTAIAGAARRVAAAFSPASLFANNEQGAFYDPSDPATLFQDAAGTVPVTAVEQPVGLMLDKSGRGNHATQATAINRPVLSARVNLLTKTEQFDDAVWTKTNTTVTANAVANPVTGNVNADALFETTTNGLHRAHQSITASATGYKFVGWVKSIGGRNLNLEVASSATGSNGAYTIFDLSTGALLASGSYGTGFTIVGTPTAISAGNEWYFCELEFTAPAGSVFGWFGITNGINNSYAGDITKGIYIWGADLRPSNDGVGLPPYQRVNIATDYDAVGFPQAESFDGIDDFQITAAGGGSTSAFFFCAAIRLNKVGAAQTIFSDTGTNTGYRVRINVSNQLEFSAGNGAAYTTINTTATLGIGSRVVITCWHDGANLNAQINNGTVAQGAFASAIAGTAQITLGRDNNAATSYFGGRLYQEVYTKDDVPTPSEIAATKTYCANLGKITL